MTRFIKITAILFLYGFSFLTSIDAFYSPSSPVLQLTTSDFKSKVLDSDRVVLVEFFASWCQHCQQLTPIWEKAATALKGVATVAAIDAHAHDAVGQEYGINAFPTIKVFVPGKPPVDYYGARDVKSIANFTVEQIKQFVKDRLDGIEKSEQPNASVELTSSNFDEMVIKTKDIWIVEFFSPRCGYNINLSPSEWKKAANNLKGKVKLGHVNCDDARPLVDRFEVQNFPTILVFGADKDFPSPYERGQTASAIEAFALEQLEKNMAPTEVTELTSEAILEDKCGSASVCFVSFLPDILDSKAEGRNKYLQQLLTVAEKFKSHPHRQVKEPIQFAARKQPDLENQVGVGGYGYPTMVALKLKKHEYVPFRDAFEVDQIINFVKESVLRPMVIEPLSSIPKIETTEAWDGKDGEIVEEDEISLEELMEGDYDTSTTNRAPTGLESVTSSSSSYIR